MKATQILPSIFLYLVLSFSASGFTPLPKTPPTPKNNPTTPAKVRLGKALYFDKRLSADDTVSCNTCHDANRGGVDGLPTSKGIGGQFGGRNAPTVWNAAYLSVQFWDGREPSLEAQAKGPLTNPIEMGMKNHEAVTDKLKDIQGYRPLFEAAFGKSDPITIDHVAQAIGAYERTLVSQSSPLDDYLRGDKRALSPLQIHGMKRFQEIGCTSCHSGPAFAGPVLPEGTGFFMKFPTFTSNPYVKKYDLMSDKGRMEHTKKVEDAHMWRVPTLRNIALTAPYFHNGRVRQLDEAVRVMAQTQLNKKLPQKDVEALVSFLKALSGRPLPQKAPKLPE